MSKHPGDVSMHCNEKGFYNKRVKLINLLYSGQMNSSTKLLHVPSLLNVELKKKTGKQQCEELHV